MRKATEIQKELTEVKEYAASKGLMPDEKVFIDQEVKDLEKELALAQVNGRQTRDVEKEVPAQPKKPETRGRKKGSTKKGAEVYIQPYSKVAKTYVIWDVEKKAKWANEKFKTIDAAQKFTDKNKLKVINIIKVKEKQKTVVTIGGKPIDENDPDFCDKVVDAWKKRRNEMRKAAGTRKTKPVTQRIVANVASAVEKGIKNISKEDLKKNPKVQIKKMERVEKAGKEFLESVKDILGEKITNKEIKEEFGGLEKVIQKIAKKYAVKMKDGGEIGNKKWIQKAQKEMERKGTLGKFTKKALRHKMTPVEFAKEVLANPEYHTVLTTKEAQFVKNANLEKF